MQKSGITRKIDELGRIVVPKEIRYNLGIRDGEPLEIYVDNNSIIIKKYSQVENIKDVSSSICSIISDACNVDVLISDREKIIATSSNLKDKLSTYLNDNQKRLIDERLSYTSSNKEILFDKEGYFTILPIITSIDSSGLVIIITKDKVVDSINYAKIAVKLIVQKIDI